MRRKQWQGSSNGPDWTDCLMLMKAMEALHGVVVTVTMSADAFDGPGGYTTIAALRMERNASLLGSPVAALSAAWPCPEHKDLVICVFAGLYALDTQLAEKVWKQNKLPFTAT